MTFAAYFGRPFFRAVAVCSVASALTTLGLIFLPRFYARAQSFDENVALIANPVYTLRLWVYLIHPLLVMAAALGVAAAKLPARAGAIVPGFLGFFIWGSIELLQQSLSLVANHYAWRAGYRAADDATRTMIRTQMFGFDSVWDALYVVLLIGFIIGNVLYGVALWKESRLESVLAALFLAAAALSVFLLLGQFRLPTLPDRVLEPAYPLLQPAARALLGVWLWKVSNRLQVAG